VRLYKNNTDYCGHSYGCHENYLIPRSIPWDDLVSGIMGFLVTRQIFAGAGKFALEAEDQFLGPGFQLSQRSDFFSELQSVDTMQRRPIINTRDEPHADAARFRRFHVIVGDANLSAFATRLKGGSDGIGARGNWPSAPLGLSAAVGSAPGIDGDFTGSTIAVGTEVDRRPAFDGAGRAASIPGGGAGVL
jgi:hypothetical protein